MKLYIGNLSYDTSEVELREFLSPFDPILDLHMPLDRETGRPRGFAFVTLSSRDAGEAAVAQLDGSELGGRNLRVREAEDRRPAGGPSGSRPPRSGGYGGQDRRGGGGNRYREHGEHGDYRGESRERDFDGYGDSRDRKPNRDRDERGGGKRYRSL